MSDKNEAFDILEIAAKANKWIEANFKLLVGVFSGAILIGIVWNFVDNANREKEVAAFNDLYKITKVYDDLKADFDAAAEAKKAKDKDPKKEAPKKDLKAASGDLEKDYGPVVKDLEAFLAKNLDKNASAEAALLLSEIYAEYKQAGKGVEALDKVLKNWKNKNIFYHIMQMRAGDLWASNNNCEKASSFWRVVAQSESFISNQAQLKLGVCLQKMGQKAEAKQWFQKINSTAPNSTEGFSAKKYLRFLDFKGQVKQKTDSTEKAS